MDTTELVKAEYDSLTALFASMPDNKKRLNNGLFENAAYMKVKLKELQEEINTSGLTDMWEGGGGQKGLRKSPAADLYNTTVKNYLAIIKHLTDCLPENPDQDAADEMDDFLNKGA